MDRLLSLIPSGEKGILPYYLFFISVVSIGNSLQNLATLHYTRRIYNGRFVPNTALTTKTSAAGPDPEDNIAKLIPASASAKDDEKARDQVSPLAARLFGSWTFVAGLIRFYASFDLANPSLYQLAVWTHVIAAAHFTSETLVFRTVRFSGPQVFPFAAAFGGSLWMALQYSHYVG